MKGIYVAAGKSRSDGSQVQAMEHTEVIYEHGRAFHDGEHDVFLQFRVFGQLL
jgi:hypothetical protein